jgi:hypothetical protein
MVLDHLLLSIQQQSFLEWNFTGFEQSLAEFYNFLLEERLQIALEILEVRACFQVWTLNLARVVQ